MLKACKVSPNMLVRATTQFRTPIVLEDYCMQYTAFELVIVVASGKNTRKSDRSWRASMRGCNR